jgi:hypothetical protein
MNDRLAACVLRQAKSKAMTAKERPSRFDYSQQQRFATMMANMLRRDDFRIVHGVVFLFESWGFLRIILERELGVINDEKMKNLNALRNFAGSAPTRNASSLFHIAYAISTVFEGL